MSVAAELARLRSSALAAGPAAYTPSILYDAKTASREPRIETAGAALNGLEALSAGDTVLPHLAEALLLHSSREDRANLQPERENEVSHAIVITAHRLAPVFPLRHTQKVLEWIVRGLEIGRLGKPEEIDALLISAMPFHESEAFVKLVCAVLIPSPVRSTWKWLQPVVDQKKPITIDFIVANAHPDFFLKAVRQIVVSALAGISSQHLNGLIVNIISRRMLHSAVQPLKFRSLVLTCLEALCFKRKRFYLVAGKKPKGQPVSAAVTRCINRAKVSLLIVLSTAIAAGVEPEIRKAILHGGVSVLKHPLSDQLVKEIATTCIIICLASANYQEMPSTLAQILAKWEKFPHALMSVKNAQAASESFGVYLSSLAKLAPTDKRALSQLRDGLSPKWKSLHSESMIKKVVCALLDAYSPAEGFQEEDVETNSPPKIKTLTETLLPIVRGPQATALDGALRKHFDERRKKKNDSGRYVIVDKSISEAMTGTPYATVKTSGLDGAPELSEGTLLSCLEHPEPSIRLKGLQRLVEDKTLITKAKESALRDTFQGILMRRVTIESDLRVVTTALNSDLIQVFCDVKEVLKAAGKRYRDIYSSLSIKKRSKPSSRVSNFSKAALAFCCRVSTESVEIKMAAIALFIGLDMDSMLPPESIRATIPNYNEIVNLKYETFEVAERVSAALFSWDEQWGLKYTKTILPDLKVTGVKDSGLIAIVTNIVKMAIACEKASAENVDQSLIAILSPLKILRPLDSAGNGRLKQLWLVVASYGSSKVLQELIRIVCVTQGPQCLYGLLKDASEDRPVRQVRVLALRWRSALLMSETLKEGYSSLAHHLLVAVCANDEELRKSAADICQQLQLTNLKFKACDSTGMILERLKHCVPKASQSGTMLPETEPEGAAGRIASELHDQLFNSFPILKNIPLSLRGEGEEGNELVSAVLTLAKPDLRSLKKSENGLSLIRSVHMIKFSSPSCFAMVLKAIEDLLEMDSHLYENERGTEVFVRLIGMIPLPSKPIPKSLSPAVASVGKLLMSATEGLNSVALTPLVALFGKALSAGLFKAAALLRQGHTTEKNEAVASGAVAKLFWMSTLSSTVGEFSAKLVDFHESVIVPSDFENVTKYLNKALPNSTAKRRRTRSTATEVASAESPEIGPGDRLSVTGALEALARSTIPSKAGHVDKKSMLTTSLLDSLWSFVQGSLGLVKNGNAAEMEDYEYQLSLVLRVLADYYNGSETTALGEEDANSGVDICFYPGMDCERELSAVERGIRAAGIYLLEALAKSHNSSLHEHVVPFLRHAVTTDSNASSRECLATIIPLLVKEGFSISEFLKLALPLNPSKVASGGLSITGCIRMCSDAHRATAVALKLVHENFPNGYEERSLVTLCVEILLRSGNTVPQLLSVLSEVKSPYLARIALQVLGDPEFLLQLDTNLQLLSSNEDEGDVVIHDQSVLASSFESLFRSLLLSEDDMRQKCLCALLAIVPGSVICTCIDEALQESDQALSLRALHSLVERLDLSVPVSSGWQKKEIPGKKSGADISVFKNMCKTLRSCISSCFGAGSSGCETQARSSSLGLSAITALHKLILLSGPSYMEEVQLCGSLLTDLVKTHGRSEENLNVLSCALNCLSGIVRVLGKNGSVFVPPLTLTVADIIEESLCEKSGEVAITDDRYFVVPRVGAKKISEKILSATLDTAIQACADVLETAPKMFGKRSLRRIAAIAATVPRKKLTELLHLAVSKVPGSQAVDSLSVALKCARNSAVDVSLGVRIVMESTEKLVASSRKSEVKALKMEILQLCISALEFRYTMFTGGYQNQEVRNGMNGLAPLSSFASEEKVMNCRKVENASYSALTEVILRVPESEFKVMFNKLSNWSEGIGLLEPQKAILDNFEVSVPDTVLTLVALQGLCVKLFGILRGIMCPYFAGVLERTLKMIGTRRAPKSLFIKKKGKHTSKDSSGKKRRREVFESSSDEDQVFAIAMENMRQDAVKRCLHNVELFLRHVSDSDEVSTATLRRIQDSVLSAFDAYGEEYLEVERALRALALRMIVTGTYRTKEESRELLAGLSKAILQRAGHENMNTRRGSLVVATAVADAVGDEYLVALPEAMPVLADVVDDEQDGVVKAAKLLVRKLEELSGESILEQLK